MPLKTGLLLLWLLLLWLLPAPAGLRRGASTPVKTMALAVGEPLSETLFDVQTVSSRPLLPRLYCIWIPGARKTDYLRRWPAQLQAQQQLLAQYQLHAGQGLDGPQRILVPRTFIQGSGLVH